MKRSVVTPVAAVMALAVVVGACAGGAITASPGRSSSPTPLPTPRPTGNATCDAVQPRSGGYSSIDCRVAAPSLANNKLGDPAELSTVVVLPPSYGGVQDASSKRYPAVYMLAGYGERVSGIDLALDSALHQGAKPEMIVVLVSGENAFSGSFYVNSPVTGNWEDAIVSDLVGYVDAHYRTLADSASRGVAGTSMGGFGALNLAMRHPETFGAVYAMSPGLFDADGADARLGKEQVVNQVLENLGAAGSVPGDPARVIEASDLGGDDLEFEYAYGTAFAPDPASPILMRFPYRLEGGKPVRDAAVWKTWEAGFGGLPDKLRQYGSNLKALRGIGIDYGRNDAYAWIPKGCAYFARLLEGAGIGATVNVHDGGHDDRLDERMGQFMLPFMAQKLASA